MAKYTETLAEQVAGGGVLPSASFALIAGFEDLFKERYAGNEIGFETETLFALRLDARAKIVMPVYADKVTAMASAMTGIKLPARGHYETKIYGEVKASSSGSVTELPMTGTASPSSSTENGATTETHTDTTELHETITPAEFIEIIDALNAKIGLILNDCLNEFKTLFMGIY